MFEQVIQINPTNDAAYWAMGKAFQKLGRHASSLECFSKAIQIKPSQPDYLREGAVEASETGDFDNAMLLGRRACEARPEDPGLVANLGLFCLIHRRPQEALKYAEEASSRDPADPVTQALLRLTRDVLSGKKSPPKGHF